MFEIRVYYHDVLRYTIISDWNKVQELRNTGFDVQIKQAPSQGSGLGGWRSPRSFEANGAGEAIVHHEDEYLAHQLAEVRSDVEQHTFSYY